MSGKSFIAFEQMQCAVCGEIYDTGVLFDEHMRNILSKYTFTGLTGLCPTHQALHEQGYVALVVIEEPDRDAQEKEHLGDYRKKTGIYHEDTCRTGQLAHLSRRVARELFSAPFPDDMPMCYVDAAVYAKLEELHKSLET